jgi:hypothetical protein
MTKLVLIRYLLLPMLLGLYFAGIVRHDVSLEKYKKFTRKKAFDCVGSVYINDSTHSGSCTLIAPGFVLTAAHLSALSDSRVGNAFCIINGQKVSIKKKHIFPGYQPGKIYGDVAVLELNDVILDTAPAILNKSIREKGRTVAIGGFGTFGKGNKFGTVRLQGSPKLMGMNVVDSLGGPLHHDNGKPTLAFIDMDSPEKKGTRNPIGDVKPLKLEFIIGAGDSGGPMFIKSKGEWILAGVVNYSTNYNSKYGSYGEIAALSRVSVFYDWIKEIVTPTPVVNDLDDI